MAKDENLLDINKIAVYLEEAEKALRSAREILGLKVIDNYEPASIPKTSLETGADKEEIVLQGAFDGENFRADDGKKYPVPANYASKSKLVVGDLLKLTKKPDGLFVYKQIKPIQRKRLIGELKLDNGKYVIESDGKIFNVILASITFFKGKPGDKFSILVPATVPSVWATIENKI